MFKLRRTFQFGSLVATSIAILGLSGCSTSVVNAVADDNFSDPVGIPWVESREYDVFIYRVGADGKTTPLHFGRYALGDKVNGKIIDPSRKRWVSNYKSEMFSDGGLSLTFHENGSLKEAKISSSSGAVDGLKTGTQLLNVTDEIEKKKLERLEREKKLKDVREALSGENE